MNAMRKRSWSPWVVGVLIGVLSWFAFLTANRGLGITTAFENTARLVLGKPAEQGGPRIDWEWMLVIGVFIGAFASSSPCRAGCS